MPDPLLAAADQPRPLPLRTPGARRRREPVSRSHGSSYRRVPSLLVALAVAVTALACGPSFAADEEGAGQSAGDPFYCGERRLGTWFYCDPARRPPPDKTQVPTVPAAEQLAAVRATLDELKARAILHPSEENVIAYVRFQREQLDRASTFSDVWQRAIWQHPDMDYTLQRPVSTLGKRLWIDNRKADRDAVLTRLGERYGLFYFYAQSCAACDVAGPILRSVADSHRLTVMAVSMDGGPSKDFPNYLVDSGQRERMGIPGRETPALVLYDTVTKRTLPVGYGILSADEIMDRIFTLTNTTVGSDF
ncbi:conjugal transfer pilus assembly protein TraF [Hephaestia caeni]|uniref:Conjugal transfer pilus assembly protein TraF n=1 Tax=Hephaestia caeni TaxID=645617 RepID=A0A397P9J7_9SPHN|nr:conjugal transfer protein TraF [Hephaestia caeni]RIA46266.1 conjugal transfer pilus assembly protein TraF [Hephaestia caeni]